MLLQCPVTLLAASAPLLVLLVSRAPPSSPLKLPSPLTPSGGRSRTSVLIKTEVRRSQTSEMPLRTVRIPPGPLATLSRSYSLHCDTSYHSSPADPDDIPDDQLHHWHLLVINSDCSRSPLTAIPSRRTSPPRRLSSSPSARVLSAITPPTTPPSFILPCVRRLYPTVINRGAGWEGTTSTSKGSGGVFGNIFSVIPRRRRFLRRQLGYRAGSTGLGPMWPL